MKNHIESLLLKTDNTLWSQAAQKIAQVEWPAGPALAKRMENDSWSQDEAVVYLHDEGKLVGFCSIEHEDIVKEVDYSPFVSSVYVNPDYRGQGLSLRIVSLAEDFAGTQNI
ncbi:GNAT family N-acetyltransferase [Streptococcus didelphis]|uniref:GNAT family N-acetyltransferase n=1 Tax=Streptococcus didelphis TaxID=102886 RepID=A0ABY9LHB0_9STRE|nr:GNAT family N-acetyltransferase [Streptococcus didelphis]WMB28123.1 GNAT family N-acetyltransferase [Streptococcus didelphis]WMB30039.1 GNAT family N-acetyltransferase [Streptococcus didelphis]